MAVIAARTRLQLEESIGYNLGALHKGETTSAGGDTSSVVDTTLWGATDQHKGKWVHVSDTAGPTTEIRRVTTNDTTVDLTVNAFSTSVPDDMEYFLWDEDFAPAAIHDFINRAVRAVTRKGAPPYSDTSLHAGCDVYSFAIPTTVVGIEKVQTRQSYVGESLQDCDAVWDTADTDVTATADDEDFRQGVGSNKFVIGADLAAADIIASDAIDSADISGYTHIEFWIKSTVALTAGQLQVLLGATAACASPLESLNVPVTAADTWTYHRVALSTPELDTAIIAVGLTDTADIGAATVWIDDLKVTRQDSEVWETVHRAHWRLDRSARKLVFNISAYQHASYSLLKLVGYKKPTELTADATECDIEPEYIIAKATALAMRAVGDRRGDRRDAAHLEADRWEALAERALGRQQTPAATRWVD